MTMRHQELGLLLALLAGWPAAAIAQEDAPPPPIVDETDADEAVAPDGPICEEPAEQKAEKPKPKPSPYKVLFFENDFSYLDEPGARRTHYYELLKQRRLTDKIVVDIGGEFRHQFKDENRRSLFTGTISDPRTDSFSLTRLRLYGNVTYSDWFRAYVEFLDANSSFEDLPPLPIDEDRSDLQNYFGEARLPFAPGESELWLRVGRQELLEGAQRLVSPLDWANIRRTFGGAKLISRGKTWDARAFWTRPIIDDRRAFDQADYSRWFAGLYSTYKGLENLTVHPYFLILREEDLIGGPVTGRGHRLGSGQADSRVYTAGAEFEGGMDDWLWDLEGAYQFGEYGDLDVVAGMVACGVGRKSPRLPWTPIVWMWYDYASGDEDPFDGTVGGFNHLFPLSHKYFGFLDLIARTNVHDVNFQVFLHPHEKLTLLAWTHFFWLAEDRDGLYNAVDVVSFQDPTGGSGGEIGQEIDLTATWNFNPGVAFQVGYCHFFSGDFVRRLGGQDFAYLLYTQLNVRY